VPDRTQIKAKEANQKEVPHSLYLDAIINHDRPPAILPHDIKEILYAAVRMLGIDFLTYFSAPTNTATGDYTTKPLTQNP
jgi:hypothetical protein